MRHDAGRAGCRHHRTSGRDRQPCQRPADARRQRLLPRPPLHRRRRSPRRVRARLGHPAPLRPALLVARAHAPSAPMAAVGARHRRRRPDAARGPRASRRSRRCSTAAPTGPRRSTRPNAARCARWRAIRCPIPSSPTGCGSTSRNGWRRICSEAYGEAWGREIAALETPPPVDLRVNRLKATVEEARAALQREGIETEPMRYAPNGLRLKRRLSVGRGRGLPERPGRDPGRGLAARRRPGRCPARHAGRRLLRRRRRQDAGASPPA